MEHDGTQGADVSERQPPVVGGDLGGPSPAPADLAILDRRPVQLILPGMWLWSLDWPAIALSTP